MIMLILLLLHVYTNELLCWSFPPFYLKFLAGLHVSRLAISDYECSLRFVQVFASIWQCAQLWQRRLGPVSLLDRLPTQDGYY
jgi:hypothetical protein